MKAILLCAGFGTRMRPLTLNFPKPLLPVGGRPIVGDLVEQIAATGRVRSVAVVTNARFYGKFLSWAESLAPRLPIDIQVLDDGARDARSRLGAISDLEFAVEHEQPEGPVLVAAGDNLFRFPLGELLDDYFREPRNLVVVHRESDPARLRRTGVVELGESGRVLHLWEKPEHPPSDLACPPLYVFRHGALGRLREFITESHHHDAPGHFVSWLAEHEPVFAHAMRGMRLDIGDLASYEAAEGWLETAESEAGAED